MLLFVVARFCNILLMINENIEMEWVASVIVFVAFLEVMRQVLMPWFFRTFFGVLNFAVVPKMVEPTTSMTLDSWWAFSAKVQSTREYCESNEEAQEVLERMKKQRLAATKEFYGRGSGTQRRYPPCSLWLNGGKMFWLELSSEEQFSLCSQMSVALWHFLTVALALTDTHRIWGARFTWALNVGDLLLMALGRPNANCARRIQMTVLHHILSAFSIPSLLYTLHAHHARRYHIYLEASGGISALLSSLQLTPFQPPAFFLANFAVMLAMRTVLFSVLGAQCVTSLLHFVFHVAMTAFNWMFISVWASRMAPFASSWAADTLPKRVFQVSQVVAAYLSLHEALLIVLLVVSPALFLTLPSYLAWTVLVGCIASLTLTQQRRRVKGERYELSAYAECEEVLQNVKFSPVPHRYIDPSPLAAPFASWVKAMLLYSNVEDHTRLKHAYPPLNHPIFVKNNLADHVNECVESLLLPHRGKRELEVMEQVCHKLPWLVMQRIAGIPMRDVDRVGDLIRELGDFVGRPQTKESLERALRAHVALLGIMKTWTDETLDDGTLLQWKKQRVFPSQDEYEANVVMLMFAGTHNLENVLGHCVRLLLENPDELEKLRRDPTLLSGAVEESLRLVPPIQLIPRTALESVALSWGLFVNKYDTVLLNVKQANRECENPDEFQIDRVGRRHLSFGSGAHLCNGSALGRWQTRAVVQALLLDEICGRPALIKSRIDSKDTYATLMELSVSLKCQDTIVYVGEHSLVKHIESAYSFRVVLNDLTNDAAFFFAFFDQFPNDTADGLLRYRDVVGRNCFKVAVFSEQGNHRSDTDVFVQLKQSRFNAFVVSDKKCVITPECGFVPFESQADLMAFLLRRRNCRWFSTDRSATGVEEVPPSSSRLLLQIALDGGLFSSARDPHSGNVSCVATASSGLWVTPRQVLKTQLKPDDFCKVWRTGGSSLCCSVPNSVLLYCRDAKSSIDSGVLIRVYETIHCHSALHFHFPLSSDGPNVENVDAATEFPYPCGSLEEALEIVRVCGGRRAPLMVKLIHHGYLLLLEDGGAQRIHNEWHNVSKGNKGLFPVFNGHHIVAARGLKK